MGRGWIFTSFDQAKRGATVGGWLCVVRFALVALALSVGGASAQPKSSLTEVASYWQIMVITMLDAQKASIEYHKARPEGAALAAALADVHGVTRDVTMRVHAYVLDRTDADGAAMIAAMLEFCRAEKRLSDLRSPFAEVERIGGGVFVTQAMALYLSEESDNDDIRKACGPLAPRLRAAPGT
jgi:hypothetical protein